MSLCQDSQTDCVYVYIINITGVFLFSLLFIKLPFVTYLIMYLFMYVFISFVIQQQSVTSLTNIYGVYIKWCYNIGNNQEKSIWDENPTDLISREAPLSSAAASRHSPLRTAPPSGRSWKIETLAWPWSCTFRQCQMRHRHRPIYSTPRDKNKHI